MRTICGIETDRPMFRVATGKEKYKVIDLVTGGESYHEEKIQAYRMCSFLINVLRHNYRDDTCVFSCYAHQYSSMRPDLDVTSAFFLAFTRAK